MEEQLHLKDVFPSFIEKFDQAYKREQGKGHSKRVAATGATVHVITMELWTMEHVERDSGVPQDKDKRQRLSQIRERVEQRDAFREWA